MVVDGRGRAVAAPRALDVSLVSERARAMGYDPQPIMDELRAIEV